MGALPSVDSGDDPDADDAEVAHSLSGALMQSLKSLLHGACGHEPGVRKHPRVMSGFFERVRG